MSKPVPTQVILADGVRRLKEVGVPDPARDARKLLAHAKAVEPGRLTLVLDGVMTAPEFRVFNQMITRRMAREPVSHIIGQRAFYGRDFKVTVDVLDPRPETEILIESALSQPFETVLDLGTGSGCILLTLLAETIGSRGVGVDLSEAALQVAKDNAAVLDLGPRVQWVRSYWFEQVEGVFDLIVSNPPYIADYEMEDLAPEVREFEPRMALTDEADGLEAYRAIFSQAKRYLAPDGRFIVEIGHTQAEDVGQIATDAGFNTIAVLSDLDRRDRVVVLAPA